MLQKQEKALKGFLGAQLVSTSLYGALGFAIAQ